jgi:hypothetical protein
MAVVQISRIQQRRGKKNDQTGLPQLASAEFAWCVDTQELFIGNGSVAEGSPYVGNTKILTEHDDLLSLISRYQYARDNTAIQTGTDASHPVLRTMQEVLDQWVTADAFGIIGDGVVDDTVAIQRAIDQLFLNPTTQGLVDARVTLEFLPGTYKITNTLFIPSYATIVGAGLDKTIFSFTGSNTMVRFINDGSTVNSRSIYSTSTYNNQPKNIKLQGITFTTTANNQVGWAFDVVRDSHFSDIAIRGGWVFGPVQANSKAIEMKAVSDIVTCERNFFNNIKLSGFTYGLWSKQDINTNTFDDILFQSLYQGVAFGNGTDLFNPGQEYGPRNVIIQRSMFETILRQGIAVYTGTGNISFENRFVNVGNNSSGSSGATYPVIDYQYHGNSSISDRFEREDEMEVGATYSSIAYAPLVNGHAQRETFATKQVTVSQFNTPKLVFRLPIPIKDQTIVEGQRSVGYEITYTYRSTNKDQSRFGKILINADIDHNRVQLVDDYEWTGTSTESQKLIFTAQLLDSNLDTYKDCIGVFYTNTSTNDSAVMYYTYKMIS